jgi:hypothetical protein
MSTTTTGSPTPKTLFPTAAELGVPPVPFHDGDLSRVVVYESASLEEYLERVAKRDAARQARAERPVVDGDLARLVAS